MTKQLNFRADEITRSQIRDLMAVYKTQTLAIEHGIDTLWVSVFNKPGRYDKAVSKLKEDGLAWKGESE